MNTPEIEAAAIEIAKAGYLLAHTSDGLRLTLNGITVKRFKVTEVEQARAFVSEQQRLNAEFLARR